MARPMPLLAPETAATRCHAIFAACMRCTTCFEVVDSKRTMKLVIHESFRLCYVIARTSSERCFTYMVGAQLALVNELMEACDQSMPKNDLLWCGELGCKYNKEGRIVDLAPEPHQNALRKQNSSAPSRRSRVNEQDHSPQPSPVLRSLLPHTRPTSPMPDISTPSHCPLDSGSGRV